MQENKKEGGKKRGKGGKGKRYRIYPGIGIARVGNSPHEYFIGPESPGLPAKVFGGYKDGAGRIKRQAARFRVFEVDDSDSPTREVTHQDDLEINWHVHLVNKKCAFYEFHGRFEPQEKFRNAEIQPGVEPSERTDLIIDAGMKSIVGPHASGIACVGSIKFQRKDPIAVKLGDLRTDECGRLLVLGGHGHSAPVEEGTTIKNYANNDGWFDDTSDGIVAATIHRRGEDPVEAEHATVLVTPPNYAPGIDNIVTLYDVVHQASVDAGFLKAQKEIEFNRDILPILTNITDLAWVNRNAHRGHGPGQFAHFLSERNLKQLSDPSESSKTARMAVFQRLRVPHGQASPDQQEKEATLFYMPQLSGDGGDATNGNPKTWLTVLESQFEKLRKWADGDFVVQSPSLPRPVSQLEGPQQAYALQRAALEPCVGGPFYPGIEMTYISGDKATYKAPFRLADHFGPGDITCYMAIPWQADFNECNTHWWPAQRPDDVVPQLEFDSIQKDFSATAPVTPGVESDQEADALGELLPWARGLAQNQDGATTKAGDLDMVKYWHELGFVVPKIAASGERVQVETERTQFAGGNVRELFYQLMNDSKAVLPKALQYAQESLSDARAFMNDPKSPEIWRSFEYTPSAFMARLNEIYNDMVNSVDRYDPATDATFRSREDVVERIKQFSPFNMSDGCWLRRLAKSGPMDDPHSLLFSVLMDEMGDGVTAHNHSNIYRDLCHSTGYYPKPISSREFAFDESIIESAFELPVFELSISAFTEDHFPELLGMTLQLEWGIYEAKNTISLLEFYGFDPHYYVMHVGIDNPSNGHAARAVEAIQIYLDNVRSESGGEAAVQEQWKRIWAGYVAFGTVSSFGQDLKAHLRHKPSLEEQMLQLIQEKAAYGSLNHGDKMLGANRINDWFSDPPGFLQEIQDSGLVIPGDWDNSPMKALTSFSRGRMYRVFTPQELDLWRSWTLSLGDERPVPPERDAQANMIQLINVLRQRQEGVGAHKIMMLRDVGSTRDHSVAWWFNQPTPRFMRALRNPDNGLITPGDPTKGKFVTEFLAPARPMGAMFANTVVGTGGLTGREIVIDWITAGCPAPEPIDDLPSLTWLSVTQEDWDAHPDQRIMGMGAIH